MADAQDAMHISIVRGDTREIWFRRTTKRRNVYEGDNRVAFYVCTILNGTGLADIDTALARSAASGETWTQTGLPASISANSLRL